MRAIVDPLRRVIHWGGPFAAPTGLSAEKPPEAGGLISASIGADRRSIAVRTRWIWMPGVLFVISRLVVVLAAYAGALLIPAATNPPPYHLRETDSLLLDAFGSRWDTGFYVSIAEEGYRFEGVPLPSVAFFPLLPLMMRALTPLVGDSLAAGILVSNLALLLAMIVLYRLVTLDGRRAVADRAVWYLLIFPAAFFGSAIYSESLFLLAAISALFFARRGYWELAALMGVMATLTRFMGVIVVPMLLVEWWSQRRSKPAADRPRLLSVLAAPASLFGLGAFMYYLWRTFGDPLAFVHGSQAWDRAPRPPWVMIGELFRAPPGGWLEALGSGSIHMDNWIDFAMAALFVALGLMLLVRRRWSESVFVLSGALLALSSGLWMSQRRYVWVLFPAFILMARWGGRPWVDRLITALSLVGLAIFTLLFANGYWVG